MLQIRMKTWLLLALLSLMLVPLARAGELVVYGVGETKVVPDTLRFTVHIREKGPLVSKLYVSVNSKVEQVLRVLENEKVAPKNIQSMELQVHPWFDYENRNRVQKGFELSRSIEVILTDTSRLSVMLDYIFRIGNLEIGNFTLSTSGKSDSYQLALKNAMDDAHSKAKLLAKNGGIKLGAITGVRETHSSVARPVAEMRMADAGGGGQFVPGQIAVSANVEVTYLIEP